MVCPDLRSNAHLTTRVATPLVTKFAMVAVQLIGPCDIFRALERRTRLRLVAGVVVIQNGGKS